MQRREFLRAAGASAGALGAAGSAAAQEENGTDGGGENGTDGGAGGGAGGGGTETVTVGPDGDTSFDPETLSITPSTTVVWEWDSDTHNVNPTSVPDESDWEGHQDIENTGFSYEHTFEVEGTYDYVCDPHSNAGMEGTVEVDPNAGQEGGQQGPTVPASAMSLAIGLVAAMSSTVALAFFFLKYGRTPGEEE